MRHFLCKKCNCIESIEAPHSVAYCTVCEGKLTELVEATESTAPSGQTGLSGCVPKGREEAEKELMLFIDEHGWSDEARTACIYLGHHMINFIEGSWVRGK